jgi:adenylylsulfate kinase
MKKINKNKGIAFWITGLSGSGKTTLGKKIHKDITQKYGPTLMISGDNLRKIFKLKGYENDERLEIAKKYSKFTKYITDQKINIIIAVVAMYDEPRKWNTLNIDNYMEIYIRSNIKDIIKLNKKKIYKKKNPGKLIGIDIKPQYPKNPTIILTNFFKTDSNKISKILMNKINNIIYEKR